MNPSQTPGYVLSARHHREADKLAQVYTRQWGKIRVLVKGVRKAQSRLGSSLELFTESDMTLVKRAGSDLYVLTQAKILKSHPGLKADFTAITLLQVMADLLLQSLQDGEADGELYRLIGGTLEVLEKGKDAREMVLMGFLLRLLESMGHPLELEVCAECQGSLKGKNVFLIPHRGGALCQDCCSTGPRRLQVSPAGLEFLKKIKSLPLEKVPVLKMAASSRRELLLCLLEYFERTIEKSLKTVEYYLKVLPGV